MVGKLIGKYQVVGELAQGRLGTIYRAQLANQPLHQPPEAQREFLLKTINFNLFTKSLQVQLKARFRREIYAQRQLQHRNIVQVYELLTVGNESYLALENFPGATLRDLLMRQGVPNAVEAVSYGRQMLAALDYAHRVSYLDESDFPRTGIVHGDIRLSNLLLDARGRIKLTDFSIIHKVIGGDLRKIYPDLVAYQSPEMQRGNAPDIRSDIFAAGSVFYEMLTGRLPSAATHNEDWRYAKPQTSDTEADSLLAIRPDVPAELAAAISRAVRRNPQDRFATMAEFLKAVQAVEAQVGEGEGSTRGANASGSLQSHFSPEPSPTFQFMPNASGSLESEKARSTAVAMKQPAALAFAATQPKTAYPSQVIQSALPADARFDVAPPRVSRRERWLLPASFACACILGGVLAGAYFFSSPRSTEGLASNLPASSLVSPAAVKAETQPDSLSPMLATVEAKDAPPMPSATIESPKLLVARQAEQQERYGEALKAYEEFAAANPNMAAASNLGVRIAGLRQFQARMNSAKEAIAASRIDEARIHFTEALKLRPNSRLAQTGLQTAGSSIATPLTVPAMTPTTTAAAKREGEENKEPKESSKDLKDSLAPRNASEEKDASKDKKEAAKPVPISYRPTAGSGTPKRVGVAATRNPNAAAAGKLASPKPAAKQPAPLSAGAKAAPKPFQKATTNLATKPKP